MSSSLNSIRESVQGLGFGSKCLKGGLYWGLHRGVL